MFTRRYLHSFFNPSVTGPVPVSQLVNERRYLERLSQSPIFVKSYASPTAVYDRDLRYEELLSKAVTIAPRTVSDSITNSEAWTVFQSLRRHGRLSTWACNKILQYDSEYGGKQQQQIIQYMIEDGVRPDIHTYNFLVACGGKLTELFRDVDIVPNRSTFLIQFEAAARQKDVPKALSIFDQMCARGFTLDDDDQVFRLMKNCARNEADLRLLRGSAVHHGYDGVKWLRKGN